LPSLFGDALTGASRPPFLPYAGEPVFDSAHGPRDSRGSNSSNIGREPHKSLTGTPGFDFDEDDEEQIRERTSAASRASGKLKDKSSKFWDTFMQSVGLRRRIEVGGERTIYINDQAMNQQFKYCNNYISTGKYNLVTFVPKFLAGELDQRGLYTDAHMFDADYHIVYRTILQIRKCILPLHRRHYANPRSFAYKSIYYHSSSIYRLTSSCFQRNAGGLQTPSK
jgi:hypothetical protein